jgi:hypothetical protein
LTIKTVLVRSALRTQKRSLLAEENTMNNLAAVLIWRQKINYKVFCKEIVMFLTNRSCLNISKGVVDSWVARNVKMVLF